jgi:hypothetical protein
MGESKGEGGAQEQAEPSAVQERLNWQLATRIDERVAQATGVVGGATSAGPKRGDR